MTTSLACWPFPDESTYRKPIVKTTRSYILFLSRSWIEVCEVDPRAMRIVSVGYKLQFVSTHAQLNVLQPQNLANQYVVCMYIYVIRSTSPRY